MFDRPSVLRYKMASAVAALMPIINQFFETAGGCERTWIPDAFKDFPGSDACFGVVLRTPSVRFMNKPPPSCRSCPKELGLIIIAKTITRASDHTLSMLIRPVNVDSNDDDIRGC